jgi:hypothetical protein
MHCEALQASGEAPSHATSPPLRCAQRYAAARPGAARPAARSASATAAPASSSAYSACGGQRAAPHRGPGRLRLLPRQADASWGALPAALHAAPAPRGRRRCCLRARARRQDDVRTAPDRLKHGLELRGGKSRGGGCGAPASMKCAAQAPGAQAARPPAPCTAAGRGQRRTHRHTRRAGFLRSASGGNLEVGGRGFGARGLAPRSAPLRGAPRAHDRLGARVQQGRHERRGQRGGRRDQQRLPQRRHGLHLARGGR